MFREVTTYERLERIFRSWVEGYIRMLLVVGPAGVGKSSTYSQVIADVQSENKMKSYASDGPAGPFYHQLTGRMSAIECFRLLRDDPRSLVIFDDLSGILGDPHFIGFLQQLCESQPCRWISWNTNASILKDEKKGFTCVAKVLIVLNDVPRKNPALQAVLDRMDGVRFEPSKAEILAKMRQVWPGHPDLIDLMEDLAVMPTLRHMVKLIGWEKSPHLNEVEELMSECGVPAEIQCLHDLMLNQPEAEWSERYQDTTGLSERSFRRHKNIAKKLVDARKRGRPASKDEPTPEDEPLTDDDQ